ncbi:hypothetical protein CDD81_473 [Ophiocordyceps australis]|uniref:Uncharacterized protein n=1 Tax=Ophiocordyceps australis TaxID=1399860 RepID=A0A2C5X8K3_9HYPO|nr:hypothetical protein CDD81_473 [Ophiocordyceps australis]
METVDCVVIGAGWYGLGAAKQYHCIRPDDALVILESQSSLGGTWADDRLYPGLKSNNLLGTYEYPDFPMDPATFGVARGQHIPGTVINSYLKAYAAKFGIDGLVRLETRVLAAEHREQGGGWILTVAQPNGAGDARILTRRLVVATGLTSEPFVPQFVGQESFGGRIFHGKQFQENRDTLETAKSVVVLGGSKFAWDAVYAYATAGVEVNWIIRASGHGPSWMSPSHATPLKVWLEKLANMRLLTWFSPCIWGQAGGYSAAQRFLHGTAIGRFCVDSFWKVLGNDVLSLNRYDSHPETAKLKPWISPMFVGDSFSILNYETDFFELVKTAKVHIHVADLERLSPGRVHLSNGTVLEADAMLAHTGWKQVPPLRFVPAGIERELGVPHAQQADAPASDLANQTELLERADAEILARFPRLGQQPACKQRYKPIAEVRGIIVAAKDAATPYHGLTSYMLHRFLVPPSERFLRHRDTVFVGMLGSFSNTLVAHLQGLWAVAYFSGLLHNDPGAALGSAEAMADLRYQTLLFNRFGKWRYPVDWGNKAPSFVFDAVPYLDLLQRDLGLDPHRKGGLVSELCSAYGAEDYRDINSQWEAQILEKAKMEP